MQMCNSIYNFISSAIDHNALERNTNIFFISDIITRWGFMYLRMQRKISRIFTNSYDITLNSNNAEMILVVFVSDALN